MEIGEEQAQAGELDEGDGKVDFIGAMNGRRQLRQKGVFTAARNEAGRGRQAAFDQRIEPGFFTSGPLILGDPAFEGAEFRQAFKPSLQAGFGGIGEMTALVLTFGFAEFETEIGRAAGFQAAPEASQHGGYFRFGDV